MTTTTINGKLYNAELQPDGSYKLIEVSGREKKMVKLLRDLTPVMLRYDNVLKYLH